MANTEVDTRKTIVTNKFTKMKNAVLLITVLFFGVNIFAQNGQVDVTVKGINVKKGGIVKIGLYKKDGFPELGKELIGENVKVTKSEIEVSFKDVPVGIYAIAIIQDKNSDGEHNTNLFGAPTEPYGFSNNVYGRFGPPDFEDVSFEVKNGEKVLLTVNIE